MSKHHHNQQQNTSALTSSASMVEEYKVIKHDLIRVVILNIIYLGGLLTIYYTNRSSHYLESWAVRIFHF